MEEKDTSGFYRQTKTGWSFAPNGVRSKNYELSRDGKREEVDGWKWYEKEPKEFSEWVESQKPNKEELLKIDKSRK